MGPPAILRRRPPGTRSARRFSLWPVAGRGSRRRCRSGLNEQLRIRTRPLSDRERQIITLAADGLTDEQIAQRLFLSRETVRTNLKRGAAKLGVSGRTALVATAIRQGLVE